jgi:PAS domain S-box-containing protein
VTSSTPPDPLSKVRNLTTRYFFRTAAWVAACAALALLTPAAAGPGTRWALAASFMLLALVCVLAQRLKGGASRSGFAAVVLAAIGLLAWASIELQWGLANPSLGFYALLVCATAVVAGSRPAALAARASALALLGLAWAEHNGWIAGASALAGVPLPRRLFDQGLLIAAGYAAGHLLACVLRHHVRTSAEREQRFSGLLGIAADAYWEMDARYRITHVSRRQEDQSFVAAASTSMRPPWEETDVLYDENALDAHRADLEAHRSFRDLHLRINHADGSVLHEMVSGEPRFDVHGTFTGYWGVSRDITTDMKARAALVATEMRHRELFVRMPLALVLHRRGRVIDANPAALALFGYADLGAMTGQDVLETIDQTELRDQARERITRLETLPVGASVAPMEGAVRSLDGRRLVLRASAVRVSADEGPATLSSFIDETERIAAEQGVRSSEALLSHLVATSPDVITLTELATGRYAMVNDTFCKLSGYRQDEVIGRTAAEIGIWNRTDDRERLLLELQAHDTVKDVATEFVTKAGRRLAMLLSAARFEMDGSDYLVVNARDVTQSERARLEREAILENASIGIALTRHQTFQLANPAFEQMFGWPHGALAGQLGIAVWPDEASYSRLGAAVGPRLARGEQVEYEGTMRRHDGSTFLCRLLARAVDIHRPGHGSTIWIAEDVTERRAVEQALSAARDAAEAASRAKSAFLANISHELRTPLNGLVGLARLARQADVDETRRAQYLEQIVESAKTLSSIVSDILDLSKVEAGKLQLEAVPFDLHTLLVTLHRGYVIWAEARGLTLALEIAPGLPLRVLGDPVRVRQILSNFLTNALKFTAQGGVRVRAAPLPTGAVAAARLRFEVIDTGIGIDGATQARLFRPFTQGDESTTRRFGGTGLGLSICRELALLMGGDVGVLSTPGQGSCFWAELPLPASADDELKSNFGPLDGSSPLADKRVLMVEDNPVNMMIGVALLEQWGVQVEQAADGRQAIAAVKRAAAAGRPYDAVLMDVQMPEMSGHEATRALRLQYDARTLPIVALTAAALVSEREEALAAGMNDFLTKPIDAQRLHDALVAATDRSP